MSNTISFEQRNALRKNLGYGDMLEIAERSGADVTYVRNFFSSRDNLKLNGPRTRVLEATQNLLQYRKRLLDASRSNAA